MTVLTIIHKCAKCNYSRRRYDDLECPNCLTRPATWTEAVPDAFDRYFMELGWDYFDPLVKHDA